MHLTSAESSLVVALRDGPLALRALAEEEQAALPALVHQGLIDYRPGNAVALTFAGTQAPCVRAAHRAFERVVRDYSAVGC